jgi:hypothetical protein
VALPRTLAVLAVVVASLAHAQEEPLQPIADNSFLVEEAYNQEAGVVQHIATFSRAWDENSWLFTYTDEWPLHGPRHQLGFTLAGLRVDTDQGGSGAGDALFNWRYQLVGGPGADIAMAPRVSLILPLGDERRSRGFGAPGLQLNVPLSVRLGKAWVTHVNLGLTQVFGAQDDAGQKADVTLWNFGQSLIWLARPRFNALLEVFFLSGEEVIGSHQTEPVQSLILNPGVRWAHDLPRGLQIVPGISVPIGVGPSSGERAVFFYLSFEYPFR